MIRIYEQVGNFSHVLEVFDTHDEASEFLEDRVRTDIKANESEEEIEADYDTLLELYFSYYSIEEIE